jgi:hypothetical protein
MSKPTKLRGGTDSELTRLKKLWRELPEAERSYWQQLFASDSTQSQIRARIKETLGVELQWDKQLNAFRDWELEQRAMDLEAERASEDEKRAMEEHPDWTKDQVRDDVLRRALLRARARGDFELGLAAVAADTKVGALEHARTKFKESLRSKLEAGLDELAESFKGNAEALKLYQQARAMISRETS